MAYIGEKPSQTLASPTSQYFNGDGSTVAFTLNRPVNVSEDLEVFVNNVQQEPGVGKSYTATGTTLTFDAAPSSGTANVYVVYRGLAEVTTRLEHDTNAALAAKTVSISTPTQYNGLNISNGTNTIAEVVGFASSNDAGGIKLYNGGTNKVQILTNGASYFNGGNVGIGTSPLTTAHIQKSDVSFTPDANADILIVENNGTSAVQIVASATDKSELLFSDTTRNRGGFSYNHNGDYLATVTAGSERMRIDSSGRVTMPYQPFARVSYSGANLGATNIVPLNAHAVTRGGMTIASNRITVPVTGAYMVGFHHLANTGGVQFRVLKNGSDVPGSRTQEVSGGNGNFSAQQIIECSANDYLEFQTFSGGLVHGNGDYNCMWAFLLG